MLPPNIEKIHQNLSKRGYFVNLGGLLLEFSGIILAGGTSRRLGQDKRFLSINGQPLIARVLQRLRPLVGELLIVSREPEHFTGLDARVVVDRYPGMGVLAGVHAGLAAAQGDWAFVVAADLPFLNPALLRALADLARRGAADVVVPRCAEGLEPLHALYRPLVCAPAAEAALLQGRRRVVSFYSQVRVLEMPPDEAARWDPERLSFFNVNTPEDWAFVQQRLAP
ncbi:MAG: molybdenum cofactor guanylyltransferase [Chloroflexi bacterium]|nr:MAG: molybdenum cofactor guanylyltransferase [Chloroflexota bacterium]